MAARLLEFATVYGSEIRRTDDFSRFHINSILNHEQMHTDIYIYMYTYVKSIYIIYLVGAQPPPS